MGVPFFSLAPIIILLASVSAFALTQPPPLRKEGGFGERVLTQRRLGGPGSSPPTCRSKCGWCSPCEPVHVPVQPGFRLSLDYYPEAWRCKCGNKLFMP